MRTNLFKVLATGIAMLFGVMQVNGQVSEWCDTPTGHLGDAEFGDTNARVLLTITKTGTNSVQVTLKPNTVAGNTNGIDYLYVITTPNATPYPAEAGADGTTAEAELSVTLTFPENTTTANFMIQYSNPNWDGRWQIELSNVDITAECDGECNLTQAPTMGEVSVASKTYNSITLNVAGTDETGAEITSFLVSYGDQIDLPFKATDGKITIDGLTANTSYDFNIKAKDMCGNISTETKTISVTTESLVYYNFPTGHLNDPNFGDPSGRILLTIQKESATAISFIIRRATEDATQPIDFINIIVNGVGQSLGDKTQSVEGEKLRFDNLASLNNMTITVQWHTPALGDGIWSTNEFTVNESELYSAGQSTNTIIEMNTECSVYPNPVADVLNIQAADKIAMATIFNLMGQQILTVNPNTESVKIDCSALTKGSYMLSLVFANGQKATYKIVK